jgi:hypothetical protein
LAFIALHILLVCCLRFCTAAWKRHHYGKVGVGWSSFAGESGTVAPQ